jgi:hypothetical protein
MLLVAEWNTFVYRDGTPVAGEIIHVEMSTDDGATWTEIAASPQDAPSFEFDAPAQYGQTVEFRARGQVGEDFGPYTDPFTITIPYPPVPAIINFRVRVA